MVAKMKSYGQLNPEDPTVRIEKTKPQVEVTERKPLNSQTKEQSLQNPQKVIDDLQNKLKQKGILKLINS